MNPVQYINMNPATLQKLLRSTSRKQGPFVKLENLIPLNSLSSSETSKLNLIQPKPEKLGEQLCTLCGVLGPTVETVLEFEILIEYFKFDYPELYTSSMFCENCELVLSRIKKLHRNQSKLREEIYDLTTAIKSVLRIKERLNRREIKTELEEIQEMKIEQSFINIEWHGKDETKPVVVEEEITISDSDDNARSGERSANFERTATPPSSGLKTSVRKPTKKEKRKKRSSYTTTMIPCYFCEKVFRKCYLFTRHMPRHTMEFVPHKCEKCSKTFLKRESLLRHKVLVCDTNDNKRELYREKFKQKWYERKARIIEQNKRGLPKCYFCQKTFFSSCKLQRHIRIHTLEIKSFKCDKCGKVLSENANLRNHKIMVCGNDQKKKEKFMQYRYKKLYKDGIKCYFCNEKFRHQLQLEYHMRRHTLEGVHQCPKCKKYFSVKHSYMQHLITVCGNDRQKAQQLKQKRRLIKIKNRERIHPCTKCSKKFTLTGLVLHSKACVGESSRSKLCSKCGLLFPSKSERIQHERTAHDVLPPKLQCYFCKKAIKRGHTFKEHMHNHTKERINKCGKCGSRFQHKYQLHWHRVQCLQMCF